MLTLWTGSVAALGNHAIAERRSLEPLAVKLAVLVRMNLATAMRAPGAERAQVARFAILVSDESV